MAGGRETVEFLDDVPAGPSATGGRDPGWADPGSDDDAGSPRWRVVLAVLLVVAGVFVGARVLGEPPPAAVDVAASAPLPPIEGGRVDLPADFGVPLQLAAVSAPDRDEVFALGTGGRVVRVVDGVVVAVSDGRGYTTLAARGDGGAVYVATGRFAPAVVALDPRTLDPRLTVTAAGRVTALTAGVGSVWAASAGGVQGWTADLARPLRTLALPAGVDRVETLSVVGASLQALVRTAAGGALLRLEPPGGAARVSSPYAGPVSLVPGRVALVAHAATDGTVTVASDPTEPAGPGASRLLAAGASIWSAVGVGSARWAASNPGSATLDCFDGANVMVGRMSVGDSGAGVRGPVVTTARAVYAVTVRDQVARGSHASCGVPPRASTGGRRGD